MATNFPWRIDSSQKQVSERETTKTLHKRINIKNAIGNSWIYKNCLDRNQNISERGKEKILIQQTYPWECQKESHRVIVIQGNQQFQGKFEGVHEY